MKTKKAFFLILAALALLPVGCGSALGLNPGPCVSGQCNCNPDPACLVSTCATSSGACMTKLVAGAQCFKGETYTCLNGKVVNCVSCGWEQCGT